MCDSVPHSRFTKVIGGIRRGQCHFLLPEVQAKRVKQCKQSEERRKDVAGGWTLRKAEEACMHFVKLCCVIFVFYFLVLLPRASSSTYCSRLMVSNTRQWKFKTITGSLSWLASQLSGCWRLNGEGQRLIHKSLLLKFSSSCSCTQNLLERKSLHWHPKTIHMRMGEI